jgi:hypothetical protein
VSGNFTVQLHLQADEFVLNMSLNVGTPAIGAVATVSSQGGARVGGTGLRVL